MPGGLAQEHDAQQLAHTLRRQVCEWHQAPQQHGLQQLSHQEEGLPIT